jgi:small subunit ribosomal protein S8
LKRVSKPSLRIYVGADEIPSIRRGLGVNILSTPAGILTDREARKRNIGGELMCSVW